MYMKFELRPWRLSDAESVARYANNKKIADNLRDAFPYPYTEADAHAFIDAGLRTDEKRTCLRAISVDGESVGSIGISLKDDVCLLYTSDAADE